MRITPEIRFWNFVNKTENCWLWQGAKTTDGYGVMERSGQAKMRVHRFSYELHNGEIPKGLEVCHSCDIRNCVNPKHLWAGTHRQNIQDGISKGRIFIKHGRNPKLTLEQIKEVKQIGYSKPFKETATKYGVGNSTIGRILRDELKVLNKPFEN